MGGTPSVQTLLGTGGVPRPYSGYPGIRDDRFAPLSPPGPNHFIALAKKWIWDFRGERGRTRPCCLCFFKTKTAGAGTQFCYTASVLEIFCLNSFYFMFLKKRNDYIHVVLEFCNSIIQNINSFFINTTAT